MRPQVIHADSREALREMADESIDACVTDPPYALVSIVKRFGGASAAPPAEGVYRRAAAGFMSKTWDTGETAFDPAFWVEVLRVLKPGAHLIAFGGTRTYHRLVCAIEDAGFEIRDQLAWLFGSGFPKSHDVSKSIDRAAGAARPDGDLRTNGRGKWNLKIDNHGPGQTGVGHADGSKKVYRDTLPASEDSAKWQGWGTALKPAHEPIVLARKPLIGTVAANVLEHGTGALNIDASRIEIEEALPNYRSHGSGNVGSGGIYEGGYAGTPTVIENEHAQSVRHNAAGRWPANVIHDGSEEVLVHFPETESGALPAETLRGQTNDIYGKRNGIPGKADIAANSGSAARFFYTAKADASDRLESKHPTVKPVDLMAYLIRLVTPPGGVVLDPFAGSGTTGMACMREGFECILIEREAEYVADIKRRVLHVRGEDAPLFAAAEKPITVGELFALPTDVYRVHDK